MTPRLCASRPGFGSELRLPSTVSSPRSRKEPVYWHQHDHARSPAYYANKNWLSLDAVLVKPWRQPYKLGYTPHRYGLTMVTQPFFTTVLPNMANKPRIEVLRGERSLGPRFGKTGCGEGYGLIFCKEGNSMNRCIDTSTFVVCWMSVGNMVSLYIEVVLSVNMKVNN